MAAIFLFSLILLVGSLEAINLGGLVGGGGGGGDGGGSKVASKNVFINMAQGIEPILAQINSRSFSSREERLNTVASMLQAHAVLTQGPLINFLNSPAAALTGSLFSFESFWITNQIFLKGANPGLLTALSSAFPSQIASIQEEQFAKIVPIGEAEMDSLEDEVEDPMMFAKQRNSGNVTWGLNKIKAQEAWSAYGFKGQGVVVGVIDTGVRYTHQAISRNWRRDKGWYDPAKRSSLPNDGNGHGTHCTGTICGYMRGIGVAPMAQWIACKGCATDSCSQSDLTACGQFMACPGDTSDKDRNRECTKAPHIVSNSWGGGGTATWFNGVISSWRAAGIIPVFAIGNNGQCETTGSPGNGRDVIGVGSTTINDGLSSFSSRGPAPDGRLKPDISAPGSDIVSAGKDSDSEYVSMSGTSMACPHLSGVVALMLSAKPKMSYNEVYEVLTRHGVDQNLQNPSTCRRGPNVPQYPNVQFGYGRVNALNCVKKVLGR